MAAKTELPVASLAPDVFARLFPEIAAFWARLEETASFKKEVATIKERVVCWQCPQASWTPAQAVPGAGKIRCQCLSHHSPKYPIESAKGAQEDRDNVRMDITDCTSFRAAVAKREGEFAKAVKNEVDLVMQAGSAPLWLIKLLQAGGGAPASAATKVTRELPEGLTLEDLEAFAG